MTAKTTASVKRAALPKPFSYAKQFKKDFESLNRADRTDMPRVKELMLLLVGNDGPLAAEWKDHALEGEWKGFRDAHATIDTMARTSFSSGLGRTASSSEGPRTEGSACSPHLQLDRPQIADLSQARQ
jgi:mRNA interferase YafQ